MGIVRVPASSLVTRIKSDNAYKCLAQGLTSSKRVKHAYARQYAFYKSLCKSGCTRSLTDWIEGRFLAQDKSRKGNIILNKTPE